MSWCVASVGGGRRAPRGVHRLGSGRGAPPAARSPRASAGRRGYRPELGPSSPGERAHATDLDAHGTGHGPCCGDGRQLRSGCDRHRLVLALDLVNRARQRVVDGHRGRVRRDCASSLGLRPDAHGAPASHAKRGAVERFSAPCSDVTGAGTRSKARADPATACLRPDRMAVSSVWRRAGDLPPPGGPRASAPPTRSGHDAEGSRTPLARRARARLTEP
jgi:hypothetical protein